MLLGHYNDLWSCFFTALYFMKNKLEMISLGIFTVQGFTFYGLLVIRWRNALF